MNEMYEYLEEHAYISKNKKSNYQFELSKARAECIANKYNSLCEEKDEEIERLNNIINELENIIDIEMNKMGYAKYDSCLVLMKMKINELKGSDKE